MHDLLTVTVQTQHDDDAAGLIFAQKGAGSAADDHHRDLILVLLHVDTGPVSRVAGHIDLAAAHGITGRIPDVTVNDYGARIHGIPHRVLGIGMHRDGSAVQVGTQRIAGNAVNVNFPVRHSGSDKPLSAAVCQGAVSLQSAKRLIDLLMVQILYIQLVHIIPHLPA